MARGTQLLNGGGYALNEDGSILSASVSVLYGAYNSVSEAHQAILDFIKQKMQLPNELGGYAIANGLTVGIIGENGVITEYSYQGAMPEGGYTAEQLKPKFDVASIIKQALTDENDNEIKKAIVDFLISKNVVTVAE